jgi:hypothetical protein
MLDGDLAEIRDNLELLEGSLGPYCVRSSPQLKLQGLSLKSTHFRKGCPPLSKTFRSPIVDPQDEPDERRQRDISTNAANIRPAYRRSLSCPIQPREASLSLGKLPKLSAVQGLSFPVLVVRFLSTSLKIRIEWADMPDS